MSISKKYKSKGIPKMDNPPLPPEKAKYKTLDLPFTVFLDAYVDDDYSQIEDFDSIYLDYCEALGGKKLKEEISDSYSYAALKYKIMLAQLCISILALKPNTEEQEQKIQKVFEVLKSLNYHMLIPSPALDDIDTYCMQVTGWINLDVINLKEMQIDLTPPNQQQENKKPTRNDFVSNLITIGAEFQICIPMNGISAREYCLWVTKYQDHCELMRKHNKKHTS